MCGKRHEFESGQFESQLERIKHATKKTKSLKYLKNNYEFLHEKITSALQTNFGILERNVLYYFIF